MTERDFVYLKVPKEIAEKIAERAHNKNPLRKWSDEAREILHAAAELEGQ